MLWAASITSFFALCVQSTSEQTYGRYEGLLDTGGAIIKAGGNNVGIRTKSRSKSSMYCSVLSLAVLPAKRRYW